MIHDYIANQMKVFNDLDVNVVETDALTQYQVNLLPHAWIRSLTERREPVKQLIQLYQDGGAPAAFSDILTKHLIDVGVIFDYFFSKCLGLAYVIEYPSSLGNESQFSFWYAPMPSSKEGINELQSHFQSALPIFLQTFLSIHDGLVLNGNFGVGFLPVKSIAKLDDWASVDAPKYPNLICVAGDGIGNQLCMDITEESDIIFDWDHEDQSLKSIGHAWDAAADLVKKCL